MFENTIDKKNIITDDNGNQIVDLTTSIFKKEAMGIDAINTVRMTEFFQMRADKVAFNEYKTDEGTEYILKYSGISNPFSLDKDDVLVIPDMDQAQTQMADLTQTEEKSEQNQVQLYYKFTNTDFKSSSKSYDALAAKKIPSGVLTPSGNVGYSVPYISDDGQTAVTIKNGRMYFGGTPEVQNKLDDKCINNGMTMADFVRANTKKTDE